MFIYTAVYHPDSYLAKVSVSVLESRLKKDVIDEKFVICSITLLQHFYRGYFYCQQILQNKILHPFLGSQFIKKIKHLMDVIA